MTLHSTKTEKKSLQRAPQEAEIALGTTLIRPGKSVCDENVPFLSRHVIALRQLDTGTSKMIHQYRDATIYLSEILPFLLITFFPPKQTDWKQLKIILNP